MAKPTKKPATIHYRRLEDPTNAFAGTTLEQQVRNALDATPTGKTLALKSDFHLRVWTLPPDSDSLFVNLNQDGGPYMFGDLVHFTSGHMQALFEKVKIAAPVAPVKQMPAEGGEYIHSMLFWYIRGNHVFLLQGRTARTSEFERYLSWLLTNASNTMPAPLHVMLRSKFDPEVAGGPLQDIEEINIGGRLRPDTTPEAAAAKTRVVEEERHAGAFEAGGRNLVANVIAAVTGGDETAEDFLSRMDPKAELTVRVTIGYKARRVKIDRQAFRDLEVGLRNVPEAEVTVKAKNGKITPLGELQLTYPTSVAVKESLWMPDDVLLAFDRAYREFAESGKIDDAEDDDDA
jgi:hypothetical protein